MSNRCKDHGHHYMSEIREGICILVCDECGHKKTVRADNTKQINHDMRRLTIQPHQERAWNETYGRS